MVARRRRAVAAAVARRRADCMLRRRDERVPIPQRVRSGLRAARRALDLERRAGAAKKSKYPGRSRDQETSCGRWLAGAAPLAWLRDPGALEQIHDAKKSRSSTASRMNTLTNGLL